MNQFLRSVDPVDDPSPWSTWAPLIGPSQERVWSVRKEYGGGRDGSRTLAALKEDTGSIPSTGMVAYNLL